MQRQIEDRRLRAPYDGAVIAIGIDIQGVRSVGSRPQPHTPISAYTPFMVVAQLEPLIVVTAKDTSGVAELSMGQTVTVTHRLARDEPVGGEVSALPAFNSGGAKKPSFQDYLQIAIDAEHPPMKIGDFVQVRVLLAVHTDTLVLPHNAVRRFAGRTFVIVQDGGRERRIDIKTGLEADGQVEILEGLEEGDVVIGL